MARSHDYSPLLNGKPSSAAVDREEPQQLAVQVTAFPAGAGRKWELSCGNIFGQCDGVGWGVCCLTTWCFPCMFGFVKYRAFGNFKKALAWALLFTVLGAAASVFRHIFFKDTAEDDDSNDDGLTGDSEFDRNKGLTVENEESTDGDGIVVKSKFADDAKTLIVVYWVLVAVCYLAISIAGAYNRMQLRKKFGVTSAAMCCECSPDLEDACLWAFCHQCATCQEARTLIVNRVEDGEWRGPVGSAMVNGVPASRVATVPFTHAVAPSLQDFDTPTKV